MPMYRARARLSAHRRPALVIIVLMVVALVPTSVARAGTTYYVSTSGSDAAAGTVSSPWRTLATSFTRLSAGDTLIVRGGTYAEQIRSPKLRAGTSTLRIKVAAYPGERPVIQGLLWLHSPTYWTFDGINVTWSSANSTSEHMVKFVDGVGWSFINGEVWGAHSYAAVLVTGDVAGQPANWRIANSCIHDTYTTHGVNQDHNIYLNTGISAGAGVLEHNLVFNAPNGRNLKMGPSGSTGGSSYVTVRYNTFYNASQPVSPSYDSNHNRFEYNIIGKSQGTNGLIHAYSLRGTDNVASNNIGFLAPKLLASTGGGVMVKDGGGNRFPLDPRFDSVSSCAGFHPLLSTATSYGRFAGVAAAAVAPTRSASTPTATVASPKRATASERTAKTAMTTTTSAAVTTSTPTSTTRPGKATGANNGKSSAQPSHGGGKPPSP
jgi:hypothetical protein